MSGEGAADGAPDERFERAVEAVIDGDLAGLSALLERDPTLARARSAREHQASLLHYIAANGVERERQRCPANAVDVARALLDAGADVNATCNAQRGPAPVLDMLVSSVHPAVAGVQCELVDLLLDSGAEPGNALMMALAFDYVDAAERIAWRTGIDNVVAAAAFGRLDLVERFVGDAGTLRAECRRVVVPGLPDAGRPDACLDDRTQLEQALSFAARSGRLEVVRALAALGVDPAAKGNQGFSAVHWAAFFGHLDVLSFLIERGAPLELENDHGGTVLGTAVWAAMHRRGARAFEYVPVVERLLLAGARVERAAFPTGDEVLDEVLLRHGAKAPPADAAG